MTSPRIVLRYFPVIGRAQALRHALTDSGHPFEDLRLPLPEWAVRRTDASFAGHLRALPTLTWDGTLVAETLPIASLIARRLGHYQGLDDAAALHGEATISSVYLDIVLRLAEVIRADVYHPGADPARSLAIALPRIQQKFELIDAGLPETPFLGAERPTMPDFFVAEAFETLLYVLGPERRARLRERLPHSAALAESIRKRPALTKAWETRPSRFTARSDEDVVIDRLRSVDLSSLGY